MAFHKTEISGLLIFEPVVHKDSRGYFFESYNEKTFKDAGIPNHFVQDNQSFSTFGVIRGLHYQLNPHAQCKLVRALKGKILDVAVDLRRSSPSFGKWVAVELSAENKRELLVPRGFAHGFSVLSETAEVSYKCDGLYHRDSECGIRYDDPQLNIDWQIPASQAIVSMKDLDLPLFANCRNNFQ